MEMYRMKGYVCIVMFCLVIGNISSKPCEPSVTRYQVLDGKFNENLTPIESSKAKTVGSCFRKCKESSKPLCMSFNYNTRSKQCLLYSTPLDTNITNYIDTVGSQNWQLSYKCQKNAAVELRDVTTEIIPFTELETTPPPEVITTNTPSSTTDYISTIEPAYDCVPGWGLLYPVLIACAVITVIILIIIAACCIHKHCEKKRKQGYRPFQPGPSRSS